MTQVQGVSIKLLSFGHCFGVPEDIDLLYSVRHFPTAGVENHQQYDGRHKRIQSELLQMMQYEDLIKMIIEQIAHFPEKPDKHNVIVAIGCDQGRHRSVAIVERLAELLRISYNVEINHRDLQRTGYDKKKKRERTANRDKKYSGYDEND